MPSRGRPQQLIETINRNMACLSLPNTLLMVQVDADDKETIDAANSMPPHPQLKWSILPREDTVAAKWNRALSEKADVYTCLGDDDPLIMPETDAKILKAASLFPDGIGMVYGHLANASFSGVISFTKKMTDLLGWIQPEHFPYWFCDHWTDDIGRITGRIAFANVRTDQRHVGRTQEMREPAWWATWFDANYMIRREHAFRVIDRLDEPIWRQEMQKTTAPLVEFRSRWINDQVRINSRNLEAWASLDNKDKRYLRLRAQAVDAMPEILKTLPSHEAELYEKVLTPPNTIPNLLRVG